MNKESTLTRLPLDQLKFGHEATPPINSRRVGRKDEIESLAASILSHGLILPLAVRLIEDVHYVIDGNRRLAAHRHLFSTGAIPADHPVDCIIREGTDAADEASLAANVMRVALHPADEYVSFHELAARGMTESEIASRFGIDVRRVRRMLALGALSPVILDAWRNDVFGSQAVECVRAFTLAPSLEAQEKVFADLSKPGRFWPSAIKEAFGAAGDGHWMLEVIGREAYVNAGGHIVEDLFGSSHAVSDTALLKAVFDTFIADQVKKLIADGWAWVKTSEEMPRTWHWNWAKEKPADTEPTPDEQKRLRKLQKIVDKDGDDAAEAELDIRRIENAVLLRGYSDEMKSRSGCVINISQYGQQKVSVTYGVLEPQKTKKVTVDPTTGEETVVTETKTIPNTLAERLSAQLTLAARDAIAARPQVALAALVAALQSNRWDHEQPINASIAGALIQGTERPDFADAFEALLKLDISELAIAATAVAAQAVNMHRTLPGAPRSENMALLNAMDPEALSAALVRHFDPDDYFKSAPIPVIIGAIEETMSGGSTMTTLQGKKKKDLVEMAMQQVVPMGWLPVELRTAAYAGPGATQKEKAA